MKQLDIDGWMAENKMISGFIQTATKQKVQDKKWAVYVHTLPNGKHYVGITSVEPSVRWGNGKGYQGQKKFYRAIQKYRWENIRHSVTYVNSEREARHMEALLIRFLDSVGNGYNVKYEQFGWNENIDPQMATRKFQEEQRRLEARIEQLEEVKKNLERKNETLAKELDYWQGKATLISETNRSLYSVLVREGIM